MGPLVCRALAAHEAGHATVALALGCQVDHVFLTGYSGRCTYWPRDAWEALLIDLGGPFGELMALGRVYCVTPKDLSLYRDASDDCRREALRLVPKLLKDHHHWFSQIVDALLVCTGIEAEDLASIAKAEGLAGGTARNPLFSAEGGDHIVAYPLR